MARKSRVDYLCSAPTWLGLSRATVQAELVAVATGLGGAETGKRGIVCRREPDSLGREFDFHPLCCDLLMLVYCTQIPCTLLHNVSSEVPRI